MIEKKVERFLLKDELFNKKKVKYLASLFKNVEKNFAEKKFIKEVMEKFPELELKERIYHMRDILKKYLNKISGGVYEKNIKIILKALPAELDPKRNDNDFGDFIFAPLGYFVAKYGMEKKNLKKSLSTLEEMTKRFSVEGEIRSFINKYPKESFSFLEKMSLSKNYHQRRLASEGLRPKLPWTMKIDFDYKEGAKLLDNLYFDKTRFVTRSVANHLNDISKINSSFVVKTLKKWKKEGKQEGKEMNFIINHSLRTLIKQGDKEALEFLGFSKNPKIEIKDFKIENNILKISKMKNAVEKYDIKKKDGQKLSFSFNILSEKDEKLIVDYKIYFQNKMNKISSKVFKIKKIKIEKGQKIKIKKKHLFKIMSTKKLYKGEHFLEIQINGISSEKKSFYLN